MQTALEIGLRKFYPRWCCPERVFARVVVPETVTQITTVSGIHTYPLPDDFAIISGPG